MGWMITITVGVIIVGFLIGAFAVVIVGPPPSAEVVSPVVGALLLGWLTLALWSAFVGAAFVLKTVWMK